MITKAEILEKINFKELIGTEFEDLMSIEKLSKGTSIYYERFKNFNSYFLIEGKTQHVIYTPEGREFYRNFFKGEIPGLNFSLSNKESPERFRPFDVDVIIKEDSLVAYLPLERVLDLEFDGKVAVLEKIITMGVEDHFKEFNNLLLKSIYSDEEFFIKYLEKKKIINMKTSKEVSEHLNINLRTLQRFLKKFIEKGIIEKTNTKFSIKDQAKLEEYKEKFKK
ncbi:MAG: hypothetical protein KAH04_01175 [Psychrilyobacter sp.]|nr:hypothetical protein [Psychrilyobacter sp.]